MKGASASDASSALRRHQAVGAYQRWNPPSFDVRQPEAAADNEEDEETRERRRQQLAAARAAAAEKRRKLEEQAQKEQAERDQQAQQLAMAAALAEQQRLLQEQEEQYARQQQLLSEEEIARIREEARTEGLEAGRNEGYAEGHAQGLREGYAAGEAEARGLLTAQADALTQTIASLDVALADLDQQVADELIALSVELARKMCQHSISRPENVRALVQDALQQIPQKHVQIHLHPQDAAHVRARLLEGLDETQQRIVEDDTLTPGGCVLLGEGNHLDASVQVRWRRILGELGFSGHEAQWEVGEDDFAAYEADAEPAPAAPPKAQAVAETAAPAAAEAAPQAAEPVAPEAAPQPAAEPEAAQQAQSAAGMSVGANPPAAEPSQQVASAAGMSVGASNVAE